MMFPQLQLNPDDLNTQSPLEAWQFAGGVGVHVPTYSQHTVKLDCTIAMDHTLNISESRLWFGKSIKFDSWSNDMFCYFLLLPQICGNLVRAGTEPL